MEECFAKKEPLNVPVELTASQKPIAAALAGVQRLTPVVQKYYATLSEERKSLFDGFVNLPDL